MATQETTNPATDETTAQATAPAEAPARKRKATRKPAAKKPGQPGLPLEAVAGAAELPATANGATYDAEIKEALKEMQGGTSRMIVQYGSNQIEGPGPAGRVLDFADPADVRQLIEETRAFIETHTLYMETPRGRFVNVEGWGFAASRLGWVAEIAKIKLEPDGTGDVLAPAYRVLAVVRQFETRCKVGNGWGYCSMLEPGKDKYTEFAVMSMAQTRAISKAYRNLLAFVIRAAGFQPTPAEEMEQLSIGPAAPPTVTIQAVGQAQQQLAPLAQATAELAPAAPAEATQASLPGMEAPAPAPPLVQPSGREGSVMDSKQGKTVPTNLYATVAQKERIITLLNSTKITRQEKTKELLNINRISQDWADKVIGELEAKIERRNNGEPMPADPKAA